MEHSPPPARGRPNVTMSEESTQSVPGVPADIPASVKRLKKLSGFRYCDGSGCTSIDSTRVAEEGDNRPAMLSDCFSLSRLFRCLESFFPNGLSKGSFPPFTCRTLSHWGCISMDEPSCRSYKTCCQQGTYCTEV